jgi:hypothetical protein
MQSSKKIHSLKSNFQQTLLVHSFLGSRVLPLEQFGQKQQMYITSTVDIDSTCVKNHEDSSIKKSNQDKPLENNMCECIALIHGVKPNNTRKTS